jgi:hypothetical protein
MKITKEKLKALIREELEATAGLEEGKAPRYGDDFDEQDPEYTPRRTPSGRAGTQEKPWRPTSSKSSTPTPSGLEKVGKTAYQKSIRTGKTSTAQATSASALTPDEVNVAAALRNILTKLESPGTQSAGTVKTLVTKLLSAVDKQTKAPTGPIPERRVRTNKRRK